jgi:hypothetical protein
VATTVGHIRHAIVPYAHQAAVFHDRRAGNQLASALKVGNLTTAANPLRDDQKVLPDPALAEAMPGNPPVQSEGSATVARTPAGVNRLARTADGPPLQVRVLAADPARPAHEPAPVPAAHRADRQALGVRGREAVPSHHQAMPTVRALAVPRQTRSRAPRPGARALGRAPEPEAAPVHLDPLSRAR